MSRKCTGNNNKCQKRITKARKCAHHLNCEDGLRIAKSTICDAGLGLFATKKFGYKSKITDYNGPIFHGKVTDDTNRYLLDIDNKPNYYIDGSHRCSSAGRFANTCTKYDKGFTNNAIFSSARISKINPKKGIATIRATKTICPGDEIFIDYGDNYPIDKKRKRKKKKA